MKVIAVMNQKGGVGKTTTVQAIGDWLSERDKRVLYVDLDSQCNLSFSMGTSGGAFETLLDPKRINGYVGPVEGRDNTFILAASPAIVGADAALNEVGKEYRLNEALSVLNTAIDYVVIDTPPALGVLAINALTAADDVVIPVQADMYSLQGLTQIGATIEAVRRYTNKRLQIAGVLITRANERTVVRREFAELLQESAEAMQTKVFNTRVRECTAVIEAQANHTSIYQYAPRSNATADYDAFMREYIGE